MGREDGEVWSIGATILRPHVSVIFFMDPQVYRYYCVQFDFCVSNFSRTGAFLYLGFSTVEEELLQPQTLLSIASDLENELRALKYPHRFLVSASHVRSIRTILHVDYGHTQSHILSVHENSQSVPFK